MGRSMNVAMDARNSEISKSRDESITTWNCDYCIPMIVEPYHEKNSTFSLIMMNQKLIWK